MASDKPWNFSQSDYTDAQWAAACLVDRGADVQGKQRYSMPVREPDGSLNINGMHDAAARCNQLQPASLRSGAAKKLIALYNQVGETPPDSLTMMASRVSTQLVESRERIFTSGLVELRGGHNSRIIGGYAMKFGKYSQNLGGYVERIAPSFPNKARADGWPNLVCRYNHKDDFLLGSAQSGTLQMMIDDVGVNYEVDVPQCRSDVLEMVTRRDVQHSSFAFVAVEEEWGQSEQGYPCRTLVSGQILDVAPVATPAYRDTSVALRSLSQYVGAPIEDVEEAARGDRLRKFFERTDNHGKPRKPIQGPAARLHVLSKKRSFDQ